MNASSDSRVAIVTGAASGIGRATSVALARHDIAVALFDMDGPGLDRVSRLVTSAGVRAFTHRIDLTHLEMIEDAVAGVVDEFGRVDILVNAAGKFSNDSLLEFDLDRWNAMQLINLTAPALLMHHVAVHFARGGRGGRIVNVSSSSGYRAGPGIGVAYAASKAALGGLTRAAAGELAHLDVNVNAVVPGLTTTEVAVGFLGAEEIARRVRRGRSSANLFERPASPEDIAEVITFLCLPESRHITAQAIHASAGTVL